MCVSSEGLLAKEMLQDCLVANREPLEVLKTFLALKSRKTGNQTLDKFGKVVKTMSFSKIQPLGKVIIEI